MAGDLLAPGTHPAAAAARGQCQAGTTMPEPRRGCSSGSRCCCSQMETTQGTFHMASSQRKKKSELLEAGWGYRVKLTAESSSRYFRSSSRCCNAMHPWSQSPSGAAPEPRAAVSLSSTKQRMTEVVK